MYRDEVIEEVWRLRDEYVRQHHYSLEEIVEDLRRRQAEHPSQVADRRKQRPAEPSGKPTLDVLEKIWAEQEARGLVGRSKGEIDAEIAATREEDERRMRQIEEDIPRHSKTQE